MNLLFSKGKIDKDVIKRISDTLEEMKKIEETLTEEVAKLLSSASEYNALNNENKLQLLFNKLSNNNLKTIAIFSKLNDMNIVSL